MGRPCTKCPPTTVQSCCGNRNLKVACVLIGCFKLLVFASSICVTISVMAGHSSSNNAEKQIGQQSIGMQLLVLVILIAQMFLTAILLAGVLKKRRNYVMIYWAVDCVLIVLAIVGLFTAPSGVGQLVSVVVYLILDIYFQIVIRSYYLQMTGAAPPDVETSRETTNRPRY